jgi:hypothetical protein
LVTLTSTVPEPFGAVAVIEVSLLNVNVVAFVAPNLTAVTPVKPLPVIATDVPPSVEPVAGAMPVTVGLIAVTLIDDDAGVEYFAASAPLTV